MTILAVSNNSTMLENLCNGLSSILPNANIIRETDSLMAGKYSFNHNFDILFADVNMKRMGGVELIRFVRQEHPGVLSYLLVPSGEKNDFPLADNMPMKNWIRRKNGAGFFWIVPERISIEIL